MESELRLSTSSWVIGILLGNASRLDPDGNEQVANIQPPLQLNSLAGTYASSAYVAAAKQGKKELDQLAEDVTSFSKTLRDDAQLKAKIGTLLRVCNYAPETVADVLLFF